MHGGVGRIVAGKPLDPALLENNPDAVRAGGANLAKQIENVAAFGVPSVVAINTFPTDTPAEIEAVREVALAAGARDAVVARHFTDGGAGAEDLAEAVWAAAEAGAPDFRLLYPDEAPLADKIETIATRIYGGDGVDYLPAAKRQLAQYEEHGLRRPADLHGEDAVQPVRQPQAPGPADRLPGPDPRGPPAAGAGFITPIAGEMRTMPGLNSRPGGERIDIDADGNIVGLF